MGAWIEILAIPYEDFVSMSLPSWERGLKFLSPGLLGGGHMSLPSWERGLKLQTNQYLSEQVDVAPLVGAWIEISQRCAAYLDNNVAPLVGAWIEICF